MVGLVCCRKIQGKQRIEPFEACLRSGTFHLLRFVHNDNRAVRGKDINRFAACKFIAFGIDNLAFFIVRALFHGTGERLRVDNHHVDSGIARTGINLLQV